MTANVDHSPVYLRLVAGIADGVLAGTYREGRLVPSTRRLSEEFGTNPATTARAVNVLVDAKVLERVRGAGTAVTHGARALVVQRRLASFSAHYVEPMIAEASLLDISRRRLAAMITAEYPSYRS